MSLAIAPVTKTDARRFVTDHHRHNEAPNVTACVLVVGLYDDDRLVGVATAGRPVARVLCDGFTLEVNRTCVVDDVKNGNSRLYGAVCRAAKALGYTKVITYTLHDESGVSLRASGFTCVRDVPVQSWSRPSRPRYDSNLFGERNNAANAAKCRWERQLA